MFDSLPGDSTKGCTVIKAVGVPTPEFAALAADATPVAPGIASFLSFNGWLDRVRAEDALVADRRELGALLEGRVVMVTEGSWKGG